MTVRGKLLAGELAQYIGYTAHIIATCSLIARHARTLENDAITVCNDANADQDKLDARWDRLTARITELAYDLPESDGGHITAQFQGDPRGFVVKLVVVDGSGIPRTFGVA
jgi:hypothetical protein